MRTHATHFQEVEVIIQVTAKTALQRPLAKLFVLGSRARDMCARVRTRVEVGTTLFLGRGYKSLMLVIPSTHSEARTNDTS